jgi:hypothetical protein
MGAPRKRRWLWLLVPALLALGAWFGLRALLEPARLSAYLLRQAQAATGLQLALARPAQVGLWPDLHLELEGLEARAPGVATPLLRVAQVDAVLPWSVLRADHVQLRSLRLHAPRLELGALRQWLAQRDHAGPPAPLRVPTLAATLSVSDGQLLGEGWRAERIALELAGLRSGRPTSLALHGQFVGASGERPFVLRLSATPREQRGAIALEALRLQLDAPWQLDLRGRVELQPPQRLAWTLEGELSRWPETWPASPLASDDPATPHALRLSFEGGGNLQGDWTLRLARGESVLNGELRNGDLFAWLADPQRPPLPPLRGRLHAPHLRLGTTELHGVTLQFDPPTPPAEDADGDR